MRWFLDRGFMVVEPIRRGYGDTAGSDSANLAAGPRGLRRCDDLQPAAMAIESARYSDAVVDYATTLPEACPDGAVILGVSTGGLTRFALHPCLTFILLVPKATRTIQPESLR